MPSPTVHAEWLTKATEDPAAALEAIPALLDHEQSPAARSILLRALGMAERITGDIDSSIRSFTEAIESAAGIDEDGAASATLSLSGSLALSGAAGDALAILDRTFPPAVEGRVHFQRGSIYARMGKVEDAIEELMLAEGSAVDDADAPLMARLLKNRGMLRLQLLDLARARADLVRARAAFEELGDRFEMAMTDHDLGLVAAADGRLAEALDLFNQSHTVTEEILGRDLEPGRCEVLLSAGLYEEAAEEALRIASHQEAGGLDIDRPEILLLAAEALTLAGDRQRGASLARQARDLFERQDRVGWAARAVVAEMTALGSDAGDLATAQEVIGALDRSGLATPAVRARALLARTSARAGDAERAARLIREARSIASDPPIDIEIDLRSAEVEVRISLGDTGGAGRAAATAMRALQSRQGAVAATDVRAGLARHASRLAERGLELALESRRPRRVWAWMEHGRASALRYRPVSAPVDDVTRALLTELRHVTGVLRHAETREGHLLRRQRALEREIADRSRAHPGGSNAISDESGIVDEVMAVLDHRALIEFAVSGDKLWGIVARKHRARLICVGSADEWLVEARGLASAFKRALVAPSARNFERLEVLTASLRDVLAGLLPGHLREVVVVPTPEMAAVPWARVLRDVAEAVVVAPSSASWVAAVRHPHRRSSFFGASGPGLIHAAGEVESASSQYRTAAAVHLPGCMEVLRAVGDARPDVTHFACHGRFRSDQPLFSSLLMADGELYLHEWERSPIAPASIVVLSSCEAGSVQTKGSEMLGIASVLGALGVRSVVASTMPIPDLSETADVMVAFHREVAAGRAPSEALALVPREGPHGMIADAFTCFGA